MNKSKKFKWFDVVFISITHHIHDIYTFFLPPLQTVLMSALAIDYKMFGLLSLIQRAPTLLNPLIGALSEKFRIRYLMILAPTITAISMCIIGVAPGYISLCIIIFISGLSSSMYHVPTPVMIRHVSADFPGKGMSFFMFGGNTARMLAPVLVAGVIELWGLKGLFNLIPAGVVASILLFIRYRNVDIRKDFDRKKSEGSYLNVFQRHSKLLMIILLFTLFNGILKSCINYYLVGYLEEHGFNQTVSKLGLTIVYLSGSIGVLASGVVSDYLGKRTTIAIVTVFAAIFMYLFLQTSGFIQLLFLALTGLMILSPVPVFLSIVNSLKSKHLQFLNGFYMAINFLGSSLATILVGWGLDVWSYDKTYIFALVISLIALPVSLFLPKK